MSDKTFIGRCFNGNFQEGTADIKLIIDGEALKQLMGLASEAKAANDNGNDLPLGVSEYNGSLQINLRVRTNRAGDKSYCELDTWRAEKKTQPQPVASQQEPEDLPF